MSNDFQIWLRNQGYTREHGTWGAWMKDGDFISGKILHQKLQEWKQLNVQQ